MAVMPYQDILVHVRPYGSIEPVEVALRLGGRFDARVTGLYALEDVARFRQILTGETQVSSGRGADREGLRGRHPGGRSVSARLRSVKASNSTGQACEGEKRLT